MKSIVIFFLALQFIAQYCMAQVSETDSLLKKLAHTTQQDTAQLKLLNEIAFAYADENPEEGIIKADEAIALAKKWNDTLQLATAFSHKGLNYASLGNDSLALSCYSIAIKLYTQTKNKLGEALMLHKCGIIYYGKSDFYTALSYHEKAAAIFQQLNDTVRTANSYNSIGVNYFALSDYNKALEFYLKALHMNEQTNNKKSMGNPLTNIGLVYTHMGNYKKAIEYHTKAINLFTEIDFKQGMANACGNLGNVYDDMDSLEKALACYKKGLAISTEINFTRGVASSLTNCASIYNQLGNYDSAYAYLQKAALMYEQLEDKSNLSVVYSNLGTLFAKASPSFFSANKIPLNDRFSKSIANHLLALKFAKESDDVDNQATTYQYLSETYLLKKDTAKAFEAYKNFIQLHDSIMNDEKRDEINRQHMQFEFDKKEALAKAQTEKQQALAVAEIRRQRIIKNATFAGTGILGLAAAFSFMFYKRRRDAEKLKIESDFKAQVSETEMKALRLQMNPHFIFNSLNSVSDYIAKHDIKTADYYLTKFAKVMRLTLENSEQKEIPLAEDLKALELYMQLELLRTNNKFSYRIKVDNDIDKENTMIPPLILQPFVENSIWHGIAKKEGEGKILIYIQKKGDMINCIVEDDGIGRSKSQSLKTGIIAPDKKSLGMKITNARIDIINKIKKTNAGVLVADLPQGLRVEVLLPLSLNF